MMKKNVKTANFGDLIESIATGMTFPERKSNSDVNYDVKILGARNVTSAGIDFSDVKYVPNSSLSDRVRLDENDLIMSVTERIGTTAVVTSECLPACINHQTVRIRLKDGVSPYFAASYLNSSIGLLLSKRAVSGSVRVSLDGDGIKKIPFPCIPFENQVALYENNRASVCEYVRKQRLIEKYISDLEKFVSEQCGLDSTNGKKMCFAVRLGELNGLRDVKKYLPLSGQSDNVFSVRDVCDVVEKKVDISSFGSSLIDRICGDNMSNRPIDIENVKTQPASELEGTFFEVRKGDILVARFGSTLLEQKIVMVRSVERTTVSSSEFLILRCKDEYNPEAVMAVLKTEHYKELMYSRVGGMTPHRSRLSRDDMLNLPFPDIRTCQEQIAFRACETREKVNVMRIQIEKEKIEADNRFKKELLNCKTEV